MVHLMTKRGRPRKIVGIVRVDYTPQACPHCGAREFLGDVTAQPVGELEQGGTAGNGEPYTHVAWRPLRCRECGKAVTLRTLENRGAVAAAVSV